MWRISFFLAIVGLCVNTALALPGSGTEADPWRIESLVDFNEFAADANYWAGFTRLETNVNLAGITYTTAVIAPDTNSSSSGFQGNAFTGVFDGHGHNVIDMTIDGGADNDYLGLFGRIGEDGQVSNLGLKGHSVNGEGGSVNGVGCVGGLVGDNDGGISNCYSTGKVTGDDGVGGLVGGNSGSISNCYSATDVGGLTYVGGLVGGSGGSISNCYSTGSVSGAYGVGGLLGYTYYGSVSNCYSTGEVWGWYYVGGLLGKKGPGSVSNSFWDVNTSGKRYSDGGEGKTTTEMQTQSTFTDAGWDFIGERSNGTTETWQMPAGGGYPVLSLFHSGIPLPLTGSGTTTDPFLIGDENELGVVNWYPQGCHFKLTRDIDLSGIQWSLAVVPAFIGCFDGDGHRVLNMQISGGGWLGLFGYLGANSRVRNLFVEGGFVNGTCNLIGGLVGKNDGSVSNCCFTGDVSGDRCVGGLVGRNYKGSVSNCYSTGVVSGDRLVGGLLGENYEGSISNCYSTCGVSGAYGVGGLVGDNDRGIVSNCYSIGGVSGSLVGGLIGFNGYDAIVYNCYSSSNVSGIGTSVGGLVGQNWYSSVSDCFWDTDIQIHGVSDSIGNNDGTVTNVEGLPIAEMQSRSTFTNAGWDFVDIWDICEGTNYPRLIRQIPIGDFLCPDGVNFIDYSFFTSHWQEDNCDESNDCDCTDFDKLGTVDVNDLAILTDSWLIGVKQALPPSRASTPYPPDGIKSVIITADLSWTAGGGATSHDVYFGTSNPPSFISNQNSSTFDLGTMAYNTTYYWRIDELNAAGKTNGLVWNFTTQLIPLPSLPP